MDQANQRMSEGATALEAAADSARTRFRPILMTAISFLPLVLASGAGARGQASLGTVVFGGLAVATVLSLFVVPVFYVVMKQLTGARPPELAPTNESPTPMTPPSPGSRSLSGRRVVAAGLAGVAPWPW